MLILSKSKQIVMKSDEVNNVTIIQTVVRIWFCNFV